MRLTIVDRSTFMVLEIMENIADTDLLTYCGETYSHRVYVWFVTPAGSMPEHAQHNAHGQILSKAGIPRQAFTV